MKFDTKEPGCVHCLRNSEHHPGCPATKMTGSLEHVAEKLLGDMRWDPFLSLPHDGRVAYVADVLRQVERETLERAAKLCEELQDTQNNPYFNNGAIKAVIRIRSLQTIRDTQAELQCRDNNHAWAYGNSACFCGKETW